MKSVSVSDNFKVPPEKLFEVLQKPGVSFFCRFTRSFQMVRAWCNGNVQWDFREGGTFVLFGGNVTGSFVKIVSKI